MNNKVEILKRHLASLLEAYPEINNDIDKVQLLPEYKMMIDAMEEYGKYCAEIAFDDGFSLGFIDNQRPSFEEWWANFQRKEATDRQITERK